MEAPARPPNHLRGEKSPYLLQHQHNPVDWHPWGEAAFARARQEAKPIFLSVGYSTCHWCHVMERESFENTEVAEWLNRHFVSLKVDREERPDVDRVYMLFVQATTGQGGWPMSVFLTPELKPFYGGTYFPPQSRYGKPGLLDLLRRIHELWTQRREDVIQAAREVHGRLSRRFAPPLRQALGLTPDVLRKAAAEWGPEYDSRHGGFGAAPKFPQPSQLGFLLRHGFRYRDEAAVRMVLHTCDRMAAGGIHDQLGGGFARYAVDPAWEVPHFEKMLYDNAQLAQLYLDAYRVSKRELYAAVARDALNYVLRDLTHPQGGFYSAEDADSEGKEGKFYCWTVEEMARVLAAEELEFARRYYGVTEAGNFIDHSDPNPLPHLNVLRVAAPLGPGDAGRLASVKAKLLAARSQRVRPFLDDKVLTSWNGLMLGALASAAGVLGEVRYCEAAQRNVAFLRAHLWDPTTRSLSHRWREGERDAIGLLEDYAFLLAGLMDFYEVTLLAEPLDWAVTLAEVLLAKFEDAEQGGFWQSDGDSHDLILRLKGEHDGAEPSGHSVAALALLRLGAITGRGEFAQAGERAVQSTANLLANAPRAMPSMLQALDFWLSEPARVVLSGPQEHPDYGQALRALHQVYQPNKVVLGTMGPVESLAASLPALGHRPTLYLCTGTSCHPPTHDAEAVARALGGRSGPSG